MDVATLTNPGALLLAGFLPSPAPFLLVLLALVLAASFLEALFAAWLVLGVLGRGLRHWLARPLAWSLLLAAGTVALAGPNTAWVTAGLRGSGTSASDLLLPLAPALGCGLALLLAEALRIPRDLAEHPGVGGLLELLLGSLAHTVGVVLVAGPLVLVAVLGLAWAEVAAWPGAPALPVWPFVAAGVLAVPGTAGAVALWRLAAGVGDLRLFAGTGPGGRPPR